MKHYHDSHLKWDVLSLADVIENCKNNILKDYTHVYLWIIPKSLFKHASFRQKIPIIRRNQILVLSTFWLIQQSLPRTRCWMESLHSVSKLLSNGT